MLGVGALEVVGGIEHPLPAGLALAAGQRAERIEPPRDRAGEPRFALAVGGDRTEQRRARLVGAVRAPQPLDRPVGAPSRLEQEMDPALLVLGIEAGVVAAARPAGIREHQDTLRARHERGGFGKIGARRAAFEALLSRAIADQALDRPVTSATALTP
jgi:hypothetical protein